MLIFVPREMSQGETRVALMPEGVEKLRKLGADVSVESGIGATVDLDDSVYSKAGAAIVTDRKAATHEADLVLRVNAPTIEEIQWQKEGSAHISFLDPFNSQELIDKIGDAGVKAISLEMIPRTTIAQKMDALSSQASLGGYVAVMLAASQFGQVLPMMMTPAGTLRPARVFVIGAGVAGLQAIATAKRLGARVDAFDTRPEVAEQVASVGAKFVKVDLGETGGTSQGYAKELTPEMLKKQQQAMAKTCSQSDIVITTAQVFGKKAPLIVTEDILEMMAPGSVLVDMAVGSGGNVTGSKPGEIVVRNGVKIIGYENLAGHVPVDASALLSNNLVNFIEHFWEEGRLNLDQESDILERALITPSTATIGG